MKAAEHSRRLLNTDQVADWLACSPQQVRRLYRPLGAFNVGRLVRFDPARVESWIAERQAEAENGQ